MIRINRQCPGKEGDGSHKTKGITHMCLEDLMEKCQAEGLALPPKPTRGLLMRMLRENTPPDGNEKVCFGSYKRYKYNEVNESYLTWAMQEVAANPQHSPDLARLARWAQARKPATSHGGVASGSGDPERSPTLPVPAAALPTAKVKVKDETQKHQRTSRTRPIPDETSSFSMVSEPEQTLAEEIADMESRLQMMKAAKKAEDKRTPRKRTGETEFSTPKQG